jgi:hypothetical protein
MQSSLIRWVLSSLSPLSQLMDSVGDHGQWSCFLNHFAGSLSWTRVEIYGWGRGDPLSCEVTDTRSDLFSDPPDETRGTWGRHFSIALCSSVASPQRTNQRVVHFIWPLHEFITKAHSHSLSKSIASSLRILIPLGFLWWSLLLSLFVRRRCPRICWNCRSSLWFD